MSKKKRKPEEPVVATGTFFFWAFLGVCVVIAAGLHITAMVLYDWRMADAMRYSFQYRNSNYNHNVGAVKYGLYKIWYDAGKVIVTWNRRVSTSVDKGNKAVEIGTSTDMYASMCPETCQDAIKTRIKAYKRIQMISIVLLAVMAISGVLATLGATYLFIFGQNTFLLFGLWIIAGVTCSSVGGYWVWETNEAFNLIVNTQQMPFPKLGFCWYLLIIGCVTYIMAAIFVLILDSVDRFIERKQLQKSLKSQMYPNQSNTDYLYGRIPPMPMHPQMNARPMEGYPYSFNVPPVVGRSSLPNQEFGPGTAYPRMMYNSPMDRNPMSYNIQRGYPEQALIRGGNVPMRAPYPQMIPPVNVRSAQLPMAPYPYSNKMS